MTTHTANRSLRERARILRFRFLKRVHRRGRRAWWTFNRATVARGVAIGLFFGVLTPVAQILFAIPVAIALRANLFVTAASTFVTNPLTLPFVYYYAYRIGAYLTARRNDLVDDELADDAAVSEAAADQALEVAAWYETLLAWWAEIALPFFIGLVLLAAATAIAGFLVVHGIFALRAAYFTHRGVRRARS